MVTKLITNASICRSKSFFKETPLADIEAGSENLRIQAEALMKLAAANDKSGIQAQVGKLLGACKNCHKRSRGKY